MAHIATGQAGQLRVGGRSVARLGKWTYDTAETLEGWIVVAKVLHSDEFWLDRENVQFDLWLQMSQRYWALFDVSFVKGSSNITIRGSGKPVVK